MAYNTTSSVYKVFLSTIQAIVPHVIFTREFHVPNSRWKSLNAKFTRSFHMKFTWGTIGCEHLIQCILLVFNDFFQECVFSSVIDYRYAVYRVWMRIYLIIWQSVFNCNDTNVGCVYFIEKSLYVNFDDYKYEIRFWI